jgi:hypothetical protein
MRAARPNSNIRPFDLTTATIRVSRMLTVRGAVLLRAIDAAAPQHVSVTQTRLRNAALDLLHAEPLLNPRYSYRFVAIDQMQGGQLWFGGDTLEAPWLLPERGTLTAVACCVITLGAGLEDRVHQLFDARSAALALVLDMVGNELLFALSRIAQDHMQSQAVRTGLTMAGELRSGDPGLALDTQRTVLSLAAAKSIGVTLSSGCVMRPLKSSSMVLGVGLALPKANWSRCDHCPTRARCRVAQAAAAVP